MRTTLSYSEGYSKIFLSLKLHVGVQKCIDAFTKDISPKWKQFCHCKRVFFFSSLPQSLGNHYERQIALLFFFIIFFIYMSKFPEKILVTNLLLRNGIINICKTYWNHHYNQVVLITRIPLTLSRNPSQSAITMSKSSGQHLVFAQSWWM